MLIVTSLAALYLFLLGRAATWFVSSDCDAFQRVGLAVAAGMLLNLSLVLAGLPLKWFPVFGAVVSAGIIWKLSVGHIRRKGAGAHGHSIMLLGGCVVAVLIGFYFYVLREPINRWDARTVWFFHAKMIWTEGALRRSAGFTEPLIAFSSPAYPNLVPALAAQLAYLKGFWNEFLPKAALLLMLVPVTTWIVTFRKNAPSFLLVVLLLFAFDGWLSNGYMDAYVVLYSGFALLFVGRYLAAKNDVDLYSAIVAAGVALNVKNEGVLFGVCLVAALMCTAAGRAMFRDAVKRIRTDRQLLIAALIAVAPTGLWAIEKNLWGLKTELAGDAPAALARFTSRIGDGATPQYLFKYLVVSSPSVWIPLVLVVVTTLFCLAQGVKLHRGAVVAMASAVLYFVGLYAAYLSTPVWLDFHLATSATRTMAGVRMALHVSMFFLLSDLERPLVQRASVSAAGPNEYTRDVASAYSSLNEEPV